jgi:hypothetical protein
VRTYPLRFGGLSGQLTTSEGIFGELAAGGPSLTPLAQAVRDLIPRGQRVTPEAVAAAMRSAGIDPDTAVLGEWPA